MQYPFKVWGFGEGIALEALWQSADRLSTPAYREFVHRLLQQWLDRQPPIEEPDHSAPGGLLLLAGEASGNTAYLQRAEALAQHMAGLPGDEISGARYHRPQHADYHDYLYVDCMEVDAPFLCEMARFSGRATFYDEAASQLLAYSQLLQDESSGLFYHQFDRSTRRVNGSFWGRGNGWALLGYVKTLALLPESQPLRPELLQRLNRLVEALARTQNEDGTWPTVLDQPESYAEASLPAMFASGLGMALRQCLIPQHFSQQHALASEALLRYMKPDGLLPGVSIATPPGNASHYQQITTGSGFPWGQGPALLALLHMLPD